jgi:hypothetical protein
LPIANAFDRTRSSAQITGGLQIGCLLAANVTVGLARIGCRLPALSRLCHRPGSWRSRKDLHPRRASRPSRTELIGERRRQHGERLPFD